MLGAYQPASVEDADANAEPHSATGLTCTVADDIPGTAPDGGDASWIYSEVLRDRRESRTTTRHLSPTQAENVAHEVGHQLGLRGDNCLVAEWGPDCPRGVSEDFGLMGYGSTSKKFNPTHISKLRARIVTPGGVNCAQESTFGTENYINNGS